MEDNQYITDLKNLDIVLKYFDNNEHVFISHEMISEFEKIQEIDNIWHVIEVLEDRKFIEWKGNVAFGRSPENLQGYYLTADGRDFIHRTSFVAEYEKTKLQQEAERAAQETTLLTRKDYKQTKWIARAGFALGLFGVIWGVVTFFLSLSNGDKPNSKKMFEGTWTGINDDSKGLVIRYLTGDNFTTQTSTVTRHYDTTRVRRKIVKIDSTSVKTEGAIQPETYNTKKDRLEGSTGIRTSYDEQYDNILRMSADGKVEVFRRVE